MAEGDKPDDESQRLARETFRQILAGRMIKIRYGRATLTVQKSSGVLMGPLGQALPAHRKGDLSAEEVTWIFIKDRAVEHSPTFSWENVDLLRLLPRVTAVSDEPKITAQTPDELVIELEAIEKRERQEWEKAAKRMKQMLPGISKNLYGELDRTNQIINQLKTPALKQAMDLNQLPNIRAVTSLQSSFSKQIELSLRPLSKKIQQTLMPQVNLKTLGIDPEAYKEFVDLTQFDFSKQVALGNQLVTESEKWQPLFREVADAARDAEEPDLADAVENSAEEAATDPTEIDLEGLVSTLNELVAEQNRMIGDLSAEQRETNEKLDDLQAGSSFSRQLFLGLAINMIWGLILHVLATKFGIYLSPSPPDDGK